MLFIIFIMQVTGQPTNKSLISSEYHLHSDIGLYLVQYVFENLNFLKVELNIGSSEALKQSPITSGT